MPLEDLPDGFFAPTRAEIRARFESDYVFRQPGAPTGKGSQPYIDGAVIADTLMPVYANNLSVARGVRLEDMTRDQLKAEARALGIPEELPPGAGGGFVSIKTSVSGVTILDTLTLKDEARNLTFRCAVTGTYFQGQSVSIVGVSTGPDTNIPAGTVLKWQNPPNGLAPDAVVLADADGAGFTGGRDEEANTDIARRITSARSDQAAGGNVATVRKLVLDAGRDLGIAIQECFVYPAITGPGVYCYVFTLRPGAPGSSRVPTDTQIAQVRAYLHRALPEDDGILAGTIFEELITVKFGVEWVTNGWVNAQPWPRYEDDVFVADSSATTITMWTNNLSAVHPKAGDAFALYNRSTGRFVRKQVASVVVVSSVAFSGFEYTITIDQANGVSDVNYVPTVGDRACPWSPSLDLLVEPFMAEMNQLGPGEQIEDYEMFDDGDRQTRIPIDPDDFPSEMRHKTTNAVEDLAQVRDLQVLSPTLPRGVASGVAGASSNMLAVKAILAFPIPPAPGP